jgi:hypothetical protein
MKKVTKLKTRKNPSKLNDIFDYIDFRKNQSDNDTALLFWNNLKFLISNSNLTENSSFNEIKKFLRLQLALLTGTIREIEKLE